MDKEKIFAMSILTTENKYLQIYKLKEKRQLTRLKIELKRRQVIHRKGKPNAQLTIKRSEKYK